MIRIIILMLWLFAAMSLAQRIPSPAAVSTSRDTSTPRAEWNACELLSPEEIAATLKSPLKQVYPKQFVKDGFRISLCVFQTDNVSRSVQVSVTQADPDDPQKHDVNSLWKKMFGRTPKPHEDDETTTGRTSRTQEDEEEDDTSKSTSKKVRSLGSKAYWVSSQFSGVLYVKTGSQILRISTGGDAPLSQKLSDSKVLARIAIPRVH